LLLAALVALLGMPLSSREALAACAFACAITPACKLLTKDPRKI